MTQRAPERIKAERRQSAIDWFVRLNAGTDADQDWPRFQAWLEADPENAAAYAAIERLWVELENVPAPIAPARRPPLRHRRGAAQAPRAFRRALVAAAASAAAILVIFIGTQFVGRNAAPRTQAFSAAFGETRPIELADGTRIQLNSASSLSVRLEGHARRVWMAPGAEAAFDVAKDARRPFLITSGDSLIRVVGTKFDIKQQNERLTVTVSRGVVEVSPGVRNASPGPSFVLGAGRQLVHLNRSGETAVASVKAEDAFAWTSRRLVYNDRPLPEVAEDLNRYFRLPLRLDAQASRLRFTGVLRIDNEARVVQRLEAFLPVVAEPAPRSIVLRRRPAG